MNLAKQIELSFTFVYVLIMVKRGHEVDIEYSKKQIMDKMLTTTEFETTRVPLC